MNSIKLGKEDTKVSSVLKRYKLDPQSVNEFQSKIKKVSEEKAEELGKKLFLNLENSTVEDVIKLVLEGANVNYQKDDGSGDFTLLKCARKNYFDFFIVLVRAGAKVNTTNKYGVNATMTCASHGNVEMLKVLMLLGADVNAKSQNGDTAITTAINSNQVECYELLKKGSALFEDNGIDISYLETIYGFDLSEDEEPSPILKDEVTADDLTKALDDAKTELQELLGSIFDFPDTPENQTVFRKVR